LERKEGIDCERVVRCGPVKRHDAERYVLISLISFAVTVSGLRTFLWLTNYPRAAVGSIHVAHVLWGGLALFAASLLLLVISNRWVLRIAAVLSGVGVGFFIDEVGKFITASNNYFTPAAVPIIYAVFMMTVLVYVHVRRPPSRDPRGEMHRALEQMGGVLDGHSETSEIVALTRRLRLVKASADEESTRQLAAAMLGYLAAERNPSTARGRRKMRAVASLAGRVRLWACSAGTTRPLASIALAACGVFQILDVTMPLLGSAPALVSHGLVVRTVLEGVPGLAILSGAVLIGARFDRRGLWLSVTSLVLCLAVTDLVVFYQEQVKGLVVTALQSLALLATLAHRRQCADFGCAKAGSVGELPGETVAEASG
jgi:hypothetical protein